MRPIHLACSCLLAAALAPAWSGQPPAKQAAELSPPAAEQLADKRMTFMKAALSRFTIRVGDRKDESKAADPCLRWNDPVSNATDGVIAVYAHAGGRPDAVAQFFFNFQKKWIVEFSIIPDADVTVLRGGREFWSPTDSRCKFADLPASPVPAAQPVQRLSQMRAIASDFAVVDYFGVREEKVTLRLLPQPAYRYAEEGRIVDGAMFVFAHGTNPECCVLLEAVEDAKGSRYRYALAPLSIYTLEAKYKDAPVWDLERRHAGRHHAKYYFADAYPLEPGEELPD